MFVCIYRAVCVCVCVRVCVHVHVCVSKPTFKYTQGKLCAGGRLDDTYRKELNPSFSNRENTNHLMFGR